MCRGHRPARAHRLTCTLRTRRLVTQNSCTDRCKCIPRALKTVSQRAREGPIGIRARTRAQAAGRDSVHGDDTTRAHSMHMRRRTAASTCSRTPHSTPTRLPRPEHQPGPCSESMPSTFCGHVASQWIELRMDTMSAAVCSSQLIFNTTSSASQPACRTLKKRHRDDQRDNRDSAEASTRA